jgi:O-antigen/teichoic acid export membrane protein
MQRFLKNKLLKNSAIISLGALLAGVFGYLFQFVVSRGLTVAGYGEFQSLNSLFLITGAVASTLGYLFYKFFPVFWKARDYAAHHAFMGWAMEKINKWIFVYFALLLLFTPLFALALHLHGYYGILFLIIAAIVGVYGTIYNSALIGWEHFLPSAAAGIIGAAGKLAAGYVIVLFFPTANAVMLSLVVGAAAGVAAYIFFHKRYFPAGGEGEKMDASRDDWKQKYYAKFNFERELGHVFAFALFMTLLGNIDIFLVKGLTSAEMTGFYGALHTLGTVILTLNAAVIGSVLPTVYAAGHEGERASAKTVLFAYGAILVISVGGLLLYAALPSFIVGMLFGAKYLSVAHNLWLFAPLAFFLSILTLEANFAYARHAYRVSWALLATVALATLDVAMFHASIQQIALAITVAFACGYVLVLCLNLWSRKKRFLEAQPLTIPSQS